MGNAAHVAEAYNCPFLEPQEGGGGLAFVCPPESEE